MGRNTNGGTRDDRSPRTGPFPDLQSRESPWHASETERGPFERRRGVNRRSIGGGAGDAEHGGEPERRRRWGRRKSDVLTTDSLGGRGRLLVRRFREPLIGLTLAGVAAPLINAGVVAPFQTDEEKAAAADASAALTAERDLDAEVGDYWAEAAEEVVRDQTIEGAVVRYGITPDLAEKIYESSARYDIEPDVAFGLVSVESTFKERAVSHVGARGLAQVMPRTAQWLDPTVNTRDLFDPEVNLDLGFRYLRQMIDKYDGDVFKALTAYNRGPGTVDRILKRGGNIDNGYAGKVMAG
jgi:hypothetical protein